MKMFRILEVVWLLIGITGIALFIYSLLNQDKEQALYFLAFTAIAAIMFYMRRRQRINSDKDAGSKSNS